MANPLATEQVSRADRVSQAQQHTPLMGFTPPDRAANQTAMAVQYRLGLELEPLKQGLLQLMQGRLAARAVLQPADAQL